MEWDATPPTAGELNSASSWAMTPPTEDELKSTQPVGEVESFARGAGNNFPLAPQAIAALSPGAYSQNMSDWNAKAAQAKAANPVSYGAGAVTGAVAPLMIPGVGEALEASPIAGNALYGAATALSNKDLTNLKPEDAKDVALSSAIGGGLGAAGEGISNLLSKNAQPIADRLEANATANALDLGTFGVKKLARHGQNPEEVLQEINSELQDKLPGVIGLGDTAGSKFSKLTQAHDAAGNVIGSIVDNVTQGTANKLPEAQEAIDELQKAASQYEGLTSARALENKAELDDAVTKLQGLQKNGKLSFDNLAALKSEIGSAYHNPNLQNHGIDQAYSILSDKIDSILDRVGVQDPAIKPQYDRAKDIYRLTSRLLPAMQRGVSREVAGTGGGLMNAALGAGALFHPLPAAAAFAGKTTMKLGAPDLAQNAAYKLMNAAKGSALPARARQAATQELIDFLSSRYGQGTK